MADPNDVFYFPLLHRAKPTSDFVVSISPFPVLPLFRNPFSNSTFFTAELAFVSYDIDIPHLYNIVFIMMPLSYFCFVLYFFLFFFHSSFDGILIVGYITFFFNHMSCNINNDYIRSFNAETYTQDMIALPFFYLI